MRDQLNSVWRQTGRKPKELANAIELPKSCYFVWKWFVDLHAARGSNGFGMNPINYTEINNYFSLMDIQPDEWEVSLIRSLDNEALLAYNSDK